MTVADRRGKRGSITRPSSVEELERHAPVTFMPDLLPMPFADHVLRVFLGETKSWHTSKRWLYDKEFGGCYVRLRIATRFSAGLGPRPTKQETFLRSHFGLIRSYSGPRVSLREQPGSQGSLVVGRTGRCSLGWRLHSVRMRIGKGYRRASSQRAGTGWCGQQGQREGAPSLTDTSLASSSGRQERASVAHSSRQCSRADLRRRSFCRAAGMLWSTRASAEMGYRTSSGIASPALASRRFYSGDAHTAGGYTESACCEAKGSDAELPAPGGLTGCLRVDEGGELRWFSEVAGMEVTQATFEGGLPHDQGGVEVPCCQAT